MYWTGWDDTYEPRLSKYIRTCSVSQLCRLSFDLSQSQDLLCQYESRKREDENVMITALRRNYCRQFSIGQLLKIKGKKEEQTRQMEQEHMNTELRKMVKMKLDEQKLSDEKVRQQLWIEFTGHYGLKSKYDTIKSLPLGKQFQQTIELDLKRTEGTKEMLQKAHGVLSAFARYNPHIGYCQGMSFIVAFLLKTMNFREDETFSILRHLTNQIIPCDYFTSMLSMKSDNAIIQELLNYFDRETYLKIKTFKQDFFLFTVQWLACLFTKTSFHPNITKTVWDHMMVEGFIAIYKACLVMFHLLRQDILETSDFAELVVRIRKKVSSMTDPEPFRIGMANININYKILELCRIALNDREEKIQIQLFSRTARKKTVPCDTHYHICMQQLENQKIKCYENTVFVFRKRSKFTIFSNYMDELDKKYFYRPPDPKYTKFDFLMVCRSTHICQMNVLDYDDEFDEGSIMIFKKTKEVKETKAQSNRNRQPSLTSSIVHHFRQPINKLLENKTLAKTQSFAFLVYMMQNQSFSNLLQAYDEQIRIDPPETIQQESQDDSQKQSTSQEDYFLKE